MITTPGQFSLWDSFCRCCSHRVERVALLPAVTYHWKYTACACPYLLLPPPFSHPISHGPQKGSLSEGTSENLTWLLLRSFRGFLSPPGTGLTTSSSSPHISRSSTPLRFPPQLPQVSPTPLLPVHLGLKLVPSTTAAEGHMWVFRFKFKGTKSL